MVPPVASPTVSLDTGPRRSPDPTPDFRPLAKIRLTWPAMHGTLRRRLAGWASADLSFLLASRGRPSRFPVTLTRRSDGREFLVPHPCRLRFLAASLYSTETLLGADAVDEETDLLWGLAETLEESLRSAFSEEEIRVRATGGFPELKEPFLYAVSRRVRPRQVIETGVAQGISTTFLLAALHRNQGGRLRSIDYVHRDPSGWVDPASGVRDRSYVPQDRGSGWIVPRQLRDRWDLSEGKAEELLPRWSGAIDLFFHDSLHSPEHMRFEYDWALAHLVPGGVLVSDDIHWNPAFEEFVAANAGTVRAVSTRYVGVAQRS
ncbi:MAG TPA: class I SAM-dependent methyltransferase [Thermoplasmata archaeon]